MSLSNGSTVSISGLSHRMVLGIVSSVWKPPERYIEIWINHLEAPVLDLKSVRKSGETRWYTLLKSKVRHFVQYLFHSTSAYVILYPIDNYFHKKEITIGHLIWANQFTSSRLLQLFWRQVGTRTSAITRLTQLRLVLFDWYHTP